MEDKRIVQSHLVKLDNIPAAELSLPVQLAQPWFKVSDQSLQLEGLCFDRVGNLYFVEVFGGTIFKLCLPEEKLTVIARLEGKNPAAIKIHRDGRLFIACLGDFSKGGSVIAMQPDGTEERVIVAEDKGFVIDDLVFDQTGGFYFTDFKGYACDLTGGVYYVSSDYQTITKVMGNLAVPNGVALTPNQKGLWVTEMSNNRLHYWSLAADRVSIPAFGSSVPYHFTGLEGPDSICIDSEGNLYVAMYQQGRVLIFNDKGYPIQHVILPGRGTNQMMRTTHPMLVPGSDELIICSNDGEGQGGSWLYKAQGVAVAYESYQFQ